MTCYGSAGASETLYYLGNAVLKQPKTVVDEHEQLTPVVTSVKIGSSQTASEYLWKTKQGEGDRKTKETNLTDVNNDEKKREGERKEN